MQVIYEYFVSRISSVLSAQSASLAFYIMRSIEIIVNHLIPGIIVQTHAYDFSLSREILNFASMVFALALPLDNLIACPIKKPRRPFFPF